MAVAKLFWSGNSQALRLPKSFRFNADKVRIEKVGNKMIIEPIVEDWEWLDLLDTADPTMEEAILEARQSENTQERDWSCFE
ncbi:MULTISPECIES: antitoxin [unclassified Mannheimia]|uniref:antitoxin n=1 Tax=unclassified Mannheimia TaxID=2645054 RepID=UPI00359EA25C